MASDSYRTRLRELMETERSQQAELRAQLPPALQASLPLDAVPIVQGMGLLADAAGIGEEIRAAQRARSSANPAVLHGRVFGRGAGLTHDTVLAAFADGARVRNRLLARLAEAIDGGTLRDEVAALLAATPLPDDGGRDAVGSAGFGPADAREPAEPTRDPAGSVPTDAREPSDHTRGPASAAERTAAIARAFGAQERALALCAERLDAIAAD